MILQIIQLYMFTLCIILQIISDVNKKKRCHSISSNRMVSNLCIQLQKKFIFLWYHVKQNGSKPYTTIWLYYMTLWYHAKQNGSKTYINPHCSILPLWHHVKQNDSKPKLSIIILYRNLWYHVK